MPDCPSQQILKGQKALVTGANSGIGKAVGLALGKAGAAVVVNYLHGEDQANEAVREFKRRGVVTTVSCSAGKIICISSVHEIIPWAGHVNYAASKGGVMLMMKSIAQELAPYRIRVNSVAPVELIRESRLSLDIIQAHSKHIETEID
jgi:NAD(P)-dependent dehydrogenase (short-subunit alcohol dehydrogenase family)